MLSMDQAGQQEIEAMLADVAKSYKLKKLPHHKETITPDSFPKGNEFETIDAVEVSAIKNSTSNLEAVDKNDSVSSNMME